MRFAVPPCNLKESLSDPNNLEEHTPFYSLTVYNCPSKFSAADFNLNNLEEQN
jgi:hypothetical protein